MSAKAASLPSLRSVYDTSLGPYLAAQDAKVISARRNRWIALAAGLGLAGAFVAWALKWDSQAEYLLLIALAFAVGGVVFFFIMTGALSDIVRHRMMSEIAPTLGLRYDASGQAFDLGRFALLGLADCDTVIRHDRLTGRSGGVDVDLVTAKLSDTTSVGVGSEERKGRAERFTGVLMRVDDPVPPGVRFRLIPPAALSPHGMLRGYSITFHTEAGKPQPSRADVLAMFAATPEQAAVTATDDAAFDARFEVHAGAPDVAVALARLDAGTRAALLDIADIFGGGPVSVGFDGGGILFAFVTKQRFEVGALRPPMAQFERVQHLADQMAVVATIAERIGAMS
jgi:hypothetical protein